MEEIWQKIAIALITLTLSSTFGYFMYGTAKPDRKEVSQMIEHRTPSIIQNIVKDIRITTNAIDKRLAVMEERIEQIIRNMDRDRKQ